MTRDEFYTIADNWYQRAHNLRMVWQNPFETEKRKMKAFQLWTIMHARVNRCFDISKQIQPTPKYQKGNSHILESTLDRTVETIQVRNGEIIRVIHARGQQ